ncbi:MAG TPA: hybrid sensor histidine kinase/response regulator [Anaerolineae bacterium]|nr:hybrid sensor histidine kinase/response regulator [Anaerolineae bacterium]
MDDAQDVKLTQRILIVDDQPRNLRLLEKMLWGHTYEVQTVLTGAKALQVAQRWQPDLILLDVMMPEMDGYTLCQRLKADARTARIPVIFLSALTEAPDKLKGFNAGGVDYITKPFKLQEVLARVETHLALQTLQRQVEAANDRLASQVSELAQMNEELRVRNEELDAFAHTVAHDLKNPLGLISGYTELLSVDADILSATDIRFYTDSIMRGVQKMHTIINNLLLLASARRMDVQPQPMAMAEVVASALERLSHEIEQQQATLSLPETWPTALGLAPWIEEVWANYISNALKYGGHPDEGIPPHVELGYTLLEEEAAILGEVCFNPKSQIPNPASKICFWVKDNGAGLTPAEQVRLFTPFVRLDQARIKGHGLGLSIVRRIIERLDGEVGVVSELGRGSIFYFTLPRA